MITTQFELLSKVTSRGAVGAQAWPRSHLEWLKKCKHCPVTSAGTEEVQARPSYICKDWRSASRAQLHLEGLKKCKQDPVTSVETDEGQALSSDISRPQIPPHCIWRDWRSASTAQSTAMFGTLWFIFKLTSHLCLVLSKITVTLNHLGI